MPINAVQHYVKGVLDGLALPSTSEPLQAVITPPVPGDGLTPTAYVWGSTGEEARQTMPRGPGFKVITHQLDIWLVWFGPADEPDADNAFPAVIDAVTRALRTTTMPVDITDPTTGAPSTILAVGERIRHDYAPVHTVADERYLRYDARLIAEVREKFQA